MRFGIFDHVERRNDVGQAQQYEERLQFAATADAAGFYCYHVAEHHHSPLCLAPNQAVYLAAVAQRTQRLRLSTLVYVLPLHNPIRLIEEICLIDQLSNGRFEVGVGRGTDRAQEWRMWGGDASENDARFEETLEVVLKGLQCEFLSHSGQFYNFKDLWMELRPCQQPLPPFWYAGNAARAGERGMNFVGGERVPLAGVRELMAQYVAAFQQSPSQGCAGRDEPLYGAHQAYLCGRERRRGPRAGAPRLRVIQNPLLKTFAGRTSGPGRDSAAGQNRRGYRVCEWGIGRRLASDDTGVLAAIRGGDRRKLL